MENSTYYATGKKKNAIARTWITSGTGKIKINKREADDYFKIPAVRNVLAEPLILTNNLESFDIKVMVKGGGFTGQACAIRHGITKALMLVDPDLRQVLKKAGFVTRDARVKERKKYGQKGARARFQFSKR